MVSRKPMKPLKNYGCKGVLALIMLALRLKGGLTITFDKFRYFLLFVFVFQKFFL